MSAADYAPEKTEPAVAMYALPYATAWPDLAPMLATIYRDRIAKLPWLPSTWWAAVSALHGKEGQVLVPTPPRMRDGRVKPDLPAWLVGAERVDAWDQISAAANEALQNYAAKKAEDGKRELMGLYANAAFWDNAYAIANVLAAPVNLARAAVANYKTVSTLAVVGLAIFLWLKFRKKG